MRLTILFASCIAALLAANTAFSAERAVTDDTGRAVTVPVEPKRVAVLHEPLLGLPLMELGIPVVGSYGRKNDGSFATSVDFMDTVFGPGRPKPGGFGAVGQLDLEKLRALKPDLIVGMELDADKAVQLSTIAPVYLQNVSSGKTLGFSVEEDLAEVVGKKEAFAELKKDYEKRVSEVRGAFREDPAGKTYLAIFLTDQLNAMGEMSGVIQALEDVGYRRLSLQQETGQAGQGGSMLLAPLSAEVLGRQNPDLLVLMNTYMGDARNEAGTRAALDRIVPGWEKYLKPAKEGRIVFVDSAKVTMPTVASARHTLDALEAWAKR